MYDPVTYHNNSIPPQHLC